MPSLTVRWLALVLALLAALYLCWLMLQPFIDVLLWALVLAVVFMPVHRRILARFGSPTTSAVLSTLLVVVTILVPASFVTVAVVGGLTQLAGSLASGEPRSGKCRRSSPESRPGSDHDIDLQPVSVEGLPARAPTSTERHTRQRTLGMVGGVVSTVVQTFLVIFTMFYVFRDGDAMRHAFYDVFPLERAQARAVVARTSEVVGASVYGVLVIAAIQGTLGGFIFWVLGLTSPLLWGVVMFFLSMIPMAGAFLVWAPAALVLVVSGAWMKGLFLTAWGVLVVGSIDNFLSPRLVGKRARLHELLIFFSYSAGLMCSGSSASSSDRSPSR